MGAWGPGLLENDVALDALGFYDERVADGASVDDAIAAVMNEMADELDDEDDRADLILALAWLASERQATPDWLAAEARQVVADEVALSRWEEAICTRLGGPSSRCCSRSWTARRHIPGGLNTSSRNRNPEPSCSSTRRRRRAGR